MKSKPPAPTSGSRLRAQNSRTFGSMAVILRGVNTRDRRPRWRLWPGRVLEDDRAGRDLEVALDELEHRALGRAVGPPVHQAALDVVEAAERIEVVLLVVVERALVAQSPPDRIGVRVDLEVVRVVVEVGVGRRHVSPSWGGTGRRASRAGPVRRRPGEPVGRPAVRARCGNRRATGHPPLSAGIRRVARTWLTLGQQGDSHTIRCPGTGRTSRQAGRPGSGTAGAHRVRAGTGWWPVGSQTGILVREKRDSRRRTPEYRGRGPMTTLTTEIPVFDADNHLYETRDALTKFLPERYRGVIDYVEVRGPHQDRRPGPDQRLHPQPDLRCGGPARRPGGLLPHGNPEGKSRREIFGEPMRSIPAFREPAPRLELMDEQGIDRCPHVPHAGQPRRGAHARRSRGHPRGGPRAQPVAVRDVAVRLRGPDLHDPGDHAAHRGAGHRGARLGARARGAKVVLIRPAPVPGFRWLPVVRACRSSTRSGRRWSSTTCSWPCTPPTAATSATPTTGPGSNSEMLPFQPQAFRMLTAWRPVEDAVSALACHGALSRFPALKVAVIENGSSWVEPLLRNMADVYKKMPQEFARGSRRGGEAQRPHQPLLGGGPGCTGRAGRRRPRPVRLRLPPSRGTGASVSYVRRARGTARRVRCARSWAATWPGS